MIPCLISKYFNDDSAYELLRCNKRYGFGQLITEQGISFLIEGDRTHNNICCTGQKIQIGRAARKLWFLGYSELEAFKSEMILETDVKKQKVFLEFPCLDGMKKIGWTHNREIILKTRNVIVFDVLMKGGKKNTLYACCIDIGNKFVETATLPDLDLMHVLAVTVA